MRHELFGSTPLLGGPVLRGRLLRPRAHLPQSSQQYYPPEMSSNANEWLQKLIFIFVTAVPAPSLLIHCAPQTPIRSTCLLGVAGSLGTSLPSPCDPGDQARSGDQCGDGGWVQEARHRHRRCLCQHEGEEPRQKVRVAIDWHGRAPTSTAEVDERRVYWRLAVWCGSRDRYRRGGGVIRW